MLKPDRGCPWERAKQTETIRVEVLSTVLRQFCMFLGIVRFYQFIIIIY